MNFLKDILKWENYARHLECIHTFENIELLKPLGEFPIGTKFPSATFDTIYMTLELNNFVGGWVQRDKQFRFKLAVNETNFAKIK